MYWPHALELKGFYNTTLGAVVCRRLREDIRTLWPEPIETPASYAGEYIAGIGYAMPYLLPYLRPREEAGITPVSAMPAGMGVLHWPAGRRNLCALTDESALPFPDGFATRVMLVHCLEYTDNAVQLLREAWRILAPGGQLLVIVPNRHSIWARAENTPFGHGKPFSTHQLKQLLEDNFFSLARVEMSLFLPPSQSRLLLGAARAWRSVGGRLYRPLGGVILAEAEKTVYATTSLSGKRRRTLLSPAVQSLGRCRKQEEHL